MADKKPGQKPALNASEEAKFDEYIKKCALVGAGLSKASANLKLKRVLEARGAVWETKDGLYLSTLFQFFFHPSIASALSHPFRSPSPGWWDNFFLKHPGIRLKIAKKIDRLHAFAANPNDIVEFFDILKEIYEYSFLRLSALLPSLTNLFFSPLIPCFFVVPSSLSFKGLSDPFAVS